jgi:hypothetical protein
MNEILWAQERFGPHVALQLVQKGVMNRGKQPERMPHPEGGIITH